MYKRQGPRGAAGTGAVSREVLLSTYITPFSLINAVAQFGPLSRSLTTADDQKIGVIEIQIISNNSSSRPAGGSRNRRPALRGFFGCQEFRQARALPLGASANLFLGEALGFLYAKGPNSRIMINTDIGSNFGRWLSFTRVVLYG